MLDLLKTPKAAKLSTAAAAPATGERPAGMVMVPLGKILDNPYQPRTVYDAEHILNLALSIKSMKAELPSTLGLQQLPMARVGIVRGDGRFDITDRQTYADGQASQVIRRLGQACVQLMFGHSRLRAFMVLAEGLRSLGDGSGVGISLAGVSEIESRFAALLDADLDYTEMPLALGFALDHAMWVHAITENSQRRNITAIEEAASIQRAMDEFGLTTEEAGKPFGYARSTAANKLRLLQLPADVRAAIADGRLTERHGRELVRLVGDAEQMQYAVDAALKKGWTVRQLQNDVDWREKQIKVAQQRSDELAAARRALAAGWTLPGQDTPVPVERLVDDSWSPNPLDATNGTEAALIAGGHCGPHCACFAIKYSGYRYETGYRPDPENAPHVVACCSDYAAQRAKKQALPLPAEATPEEIAKRREAEERKQRVIDLNNESQRIWQAWVKDQDLQLLWNDIRFWKQAAKHMGWLVQVFDNCESTYDGCQEVLRILYKKTRHHDPELKEDVHKPAEVKALIKALGGRSDEE